MLNFFYSFIYLDEKNKAHLAYHALYFIQNSKSFKILNYLVDANNGQVLKQWDESKLKPYVPGTFFSEPKGVPHFVWAKDGEVVIQVTAMGPTGVTRIPQKQ